MYVGGALIRRFDGFRRLCRRAAEEFNHVLKLPETDLLLANRVLAALGGPPARPEVRGAFEGDGLPLLLLFLLTQEFPGRLGLVGTTEATMARLKALVHLFGHAAHPLLTSGHALPFQEVVRELGPSGAVLRPCVTYDPDGEPLTISPTGSACTLRIGTERGPYHLAVLLGEGTGPAPLMPATPGMHPTVLILP